MPEQIPMNRSEEYQGLAEGMVGKGAMTAAEYGIPAAGAYYGGKALINSMRGPVAPPMTPPMSSAPPSTPTGQSSATIGNATWDAALKRPVPPGPPTGTIDYATKVIKSIALNKVMQGAGSLSKMLPAATVGANLFGTGADEIATLKAAEEKRKQQGLPF